MTIAQAQFGPMNVGGAAEARRSFNALILAAAVLACEPLLRALLWWQLPGPGLHSFFHADSAWLQVGVLAPLGLCLVPQVRELVARHRWLLALFLLWTVAAVLSSAAALMPAIAFNRNVRWLMHLAFALNLLLALQQRPDRAPTLLLAWCVGFLGYAAVIVAFIMAAQGAPAFDWVIGLPGAFNVRHIGFEAMAAALIGTLLRPSALRSKASIWLLRATAVAGWAVIFWSGGRGSFLASIGALAVVWWLCPIERRWQRLVEMLCLIAAGFAVATLHVPPSESFGAWRTLGFAPEAAGEDTDVSSGRVLMWMEAARTVAANPLLGIGDGQVKYRLVTAYGHYAQPHNLLLQTFLAWGIPAGVAFLSAIGFALLRAVGRVRADAAITSPAAAGLAIAFALAANALIDGTLYHPRPVTLFLLGLCVALAGPRGIVRTP